MSSTSPERAEIFLKDDAATTAFGRWMAAELRPGDTFFLSGGIGAGKTHFARAVIRARMSDVTDVPSPTYTLVQTYGEGGARIVHADLYRLSHPDEVAELGLYDALETAICLIEWPERLGNPIHIHALRLDFAMAGDGRSVTVTGPTRLVARAAAFADGGSHGPV
jgi:tRNA threonylcarbamoyl adenosine modification protein YjeE